MYYLVACCERIITLTRRFLLTVQDEEYSFFFFMPNKTTHRRFEKFRSDITGEKLLSVLKEARASTVDVSYLLIYLEWLRMTFLLYVKENKRDSHLTSNSNL